MFRLSPASRAVRSARLAGLALVAVFASVIFRGDSKAIGNTVDNTPSSSPAQEPATGGRPATDPLVAAKPPANPADDPPPAKSPTTDDDGFTPIKFGLDIFQSEAQVWKEFKFPSAGKPIRVLVIEPKGVGKHPAVVML